MTHDMSESNALATAVQTSILGYLMHLTNQPNFPNRQTQLTPLSTHSLNTKFHCASSAMTVPVSLSLSLSQHSSTYTARQTPMLQAPISRLPVSANIRQAPLLLHTTEPQVFNYSRITLQMWQLNPRSLTKQTRPSVVLMPTFLQSMATKPDHLGIIPGSHANLSQLCGN